ncbi:MAG: hypothetical protein U9N42_07365 [Campylobacterota bacterium]|nr:hypothetical protein [Campylobacterota bacterium]
MVLKYFLLSFLVLMMVGCNTSDDNVVYNSASTPSGTSGASATSGASTTGGGGSSTSTSISGKVIDGYWRNALVCLDENENGACDTNEPSVRSGVGGVYNLAVISSSLGLYSLLAIGDTNTIDENNDTNFSQTVILSTPKDELVANKEIHITPITSMVHQAMQEGATYDVAKNIIKDSLGLTSISQVNEDFIAKGDSNIAQKAKDIVKLLNNNKDNSKTVLKIIEDGYFSGGLNFSAISSTLEIHSSTTATLKLDGSHDLDNLTVKLESSDEKVLKTSTSQCILSTNAPSCSFDVEAIGSGTAYIKAVASGHASPIVRIAVTTKKGQLKQSLSSHVISVDDGNNTTDLTVALEDSAGIESLNIQLKVLNDGIAKLSKSSCILSTANNSCSVKVTALNAGKTQISAEATGYSKSITALGVDADAGVLSLVIPNSTIHSNEYVKAELRLVGSKDVNAFSTELKDTNSLVLFYNENKSSEITTCSLSTQNPVCKFYMWGVKHGQTQVSASATGYYSVSHQIEEKDAEVGVLDLHIDSLKLSPGETTLATLQLHHSYGVSPFTVELKDSNESVIKLSQTSCTLSSSQNSCEFNITAMSNIDGGRSVITTSSANYHPIQQGVYVKDENNSAVLQMKLFPSSVTLNSSSNCSKVNESLSANIEYYGPTLTNSLDVKIESNNTAIFNPGDLYKCTIAAGASKCTITNSAGFNNKAGKVILYVHAENNDSIKESNRTLQVKPTFGDVKGEFVNPDTKDGNPYLKTNSSGNYQFKATVNNACLGGNKYYLNAGDKVRSISPDIATIDGNCSIAQSADSCTYGIDTKSTLGFAKFEIDYPTKNVFEKSIKVGISNSGHIAFAFDKNISDMSLGQSYHGKLKLQNSNVPVSSFEVQFSSTNDKIATIQALEHNGSKTNKCSLSSTTPECDIIVSAIGEGGSGELKAIASHYDKKKDYQAYIPFDVPSNTNPSSAGALNISIDQVYLMEEGSTTTGTITFDGPANGTELDSILKSLKIDSNDSSKIKVMNQCDNFSKNSLCKFSIKASSTPSPGTNFPVAITATAGVYKAAEVVSWIDSAIETNHVPSITFNLPYNIKLKAPSGSTTETNITTTFGGFNGAPYTLKTETNNSRVTSSDITINAMGSNTKQDKNIILSNTQTQSGDVKITIKKGSTVLREYIASMALDYGTFSSDLDSVVLFADNSKRVTVKLDGAKTGSTDLNVTIKSSNTDIIDVNTSQLTLRESDLKSNSFELIPKKLGNATITIIDNHNGSVVSRKNLTVLPSQGGFVGSVNIDINNTVLVSGEFAQGTIYLDGASSDKELSNIFLSSSDTSKVKITQYQCAKLSSENNCTFTIQAQANVEANQHALISVNADNYKAAQYVNVNNTNNKTMPQFVPSMRFKLPYTIQSKEPGATNGSDTIISVIVGSFAGGGPQLNFETNNSNIANTNITINANNNQQEKNATLTNNQTQSGYVKVLIKYENAILREYIADMNLTYGTIITGLDKAVIIYDTNTTVGVSLSDSYTGTLKREVTITSSNPSDIDINETKLTLSNASNPFSSFKLIPKKSSGSSTITITDIRTSNVIASKTLNINSDYIQIADIAKNVGIDINKSIKVEMSGFVNPETITFTTDNLILDSNSLKFTSNGTQEISYHGINKGPASLIVDDGKTKKTYFINVVPDSELYRYFSFENNCNYDIWLDFSAGYAANKPCDINNPNSCEKPSVCSQTPGFGYKCTVPAGERKNSITVNKVCSTGLVDETNGLCICDSTHSCEAGQYCNFSTATPTCFYNSTEPVHANGEKSWKISAGESNVNLTWVNDITQDVTVSGNIVPQTGCTEDGRFCKTLEKSTTPRSTIEFTLQNNVPACPWCNDYYDISYINGINVPVMVTPINPKENLLSDDSNYYICGGAGVPVGNAFFANNLNPTLATKASSAGCSYDKNAFKVNSNSYLSQNQGFNFVNDAIKLGALKVTKIDNFDATNKSISGKVEFQKSQNEAFKIYALESNGTIGETVFYTSSDADAENNISFTIKTTDTTKELHFVNSGVKNSVVLPLVNNNNQSSLYLELDNVTVEENRSKVLGVIKLEGAKSDFTVNLTSSNVDVADLNESSLILNSNNSYTSTFEITVKSFGIVDINASATNLVTATTPFRYQPADYNCSTESDCTNLGGTCGLSHGAVESYDEANASAVTLSNQTTCGERLGYWTYTQFCSVATKTDSDPTTVYKNASLGINCTNGGGQNIRDYALCNGSASTSCYSGGAADNCCGCANWNTESSPDSSLQNAFNTDVQVDACNSYSTIWTQNVLKPVSFIKNMSWSAYSYQFDDKSSTFQCNTKNEVEDLNKTAYNETNYKVSFCPAGSNSSQFKTADIQPTTSYDPICFVKDDNSKKIYGIQVQVPGSSSANVIIDDNTTNVSGSKVFALNPNSKAKIVTFPGETYSQTCSVILDSNGCPYLSTENAKESCGTFVINTNEQANYTSITYGDRK